VLHQKYGMRKTTQDGPWDRWHGAYAPKNIRKIRYIDLVGLASQESLTGTKDRPVHV